MRPQKGVPKQRTSSFMELAKNFPFAEAEARWYAAWAEAGCFSSTPDDRPPYTIVMPPPNVTGVLHMGHALNNTVQDALIRRAKSEGYNTCWVPGTDHASIATEAKVTAALRAKGIDKASLSREEFLQHAWAWKEEYGGIILEQLKKLGCALDWKRTAFTMDEGYYQAVIRAFVQLYNEGYIYRAARMVNWDPIAKTALSDEEVIYKPSTGKLTYVRYPICDAAGALLPKARGITIATVRPETIPGDTGVCVHPADERYAHLRGAFCLIPIVNRVVPIVFDEYIDPAFGTGALKVTPAHDPADYALGQSHNLAAVDVLNDDGTMSTAAGPYVGMDRFDARRRIVDDLRAGGYLVKEEPYENQVGHSERTDAVIEPRLSMQWWCRMEKLATPALRAIMDDAVRFFPPKYKNLYRHWMENIHDWCISRQLWWGQRIPAWYDADGNIYVAENEDEARAQATATNPQARLQRQDDDVLDTWFSSWLWPFQVFGWNGAPDNHELAYYYPTTTLVTAPEIIFFWVARMIMAGEQFLGRKPFEQVYFTGIVRDKKGKKMSKSLGNSPDLLKLIDQYGADSVRFSVTISSPAGNDLLFDEAALDQGRAFINKIWNALRLVKSWEARVDAASGDPSFVPFAMRWMEARLDAASAALAEDLKAFRLSEGLKSLYSVIWDDFCSWYLEWVKPASPDATIPANVYTATVNCFARLLQLLHPYMPFITEEADAALHPRAAGEFLLTRALAKAAPADADILTEGSRLQTLITAVREARGKAGLKSRDRIQLHVSADGFFTRVEETLAKQTGADVLHGSAPEAATPLVVGTDRVMILFPEGAAPPAGGAGGDHQKEISHLQAFLATVEKKLSNERFMQSARPEVVASEQKKRADTLARIRLLEETAGAS